jgi:hypothetical protein
LLVTGSARMDTFRQGGESLAGRCFSCRLCPLSVRECCDRLGTTADAALTRLLERGGFPEPCLAEDASTAERWRAIHDRLAARRRARLLPRARTQRHAHLCGDAAPACGLAGVAGGPQALIECEWADERPHRALARFAAAMAQAQAVQLVRELRQEEDRGAVRIRRAAVWLATLAA